MDGFVSVCLRPGRTYYSTDYFVYVMSKMKIKRSDVELCKQFPCSFVYVGVYKDVEYRYTEVEANGIKMYVGFIYLVARLLSKSFLCNSVMSSAQVEWWLEHRHGWLVKRQWAGSVLGWVSRDEYQVLGSTSIPAILDTLVYWEPFSWLTGVDTTRNTVNRLGWSRIGLAELILHAAGVGRSYR